MKDSAVSYCNINITTTSNDMENILQNCYDFGVPVERKIFEKIYNITVQFIVKLSATYDLGYRSVVYSFVYFSEK